MSKIKVTQQQRDNALEALNVMWPSIPEENVFRRLDDWRGYDDGGAPTCGTIACFGGWSECYPPFREQLGLPLEPSDDWWNGWQTAELYGPYLMEPRINSLFNVRGGHIADAGFEGSDHALVTNRLKWLIDNTEVA